MQTQTISKAPRKMRIEAIQGKQTFEEIDRLDNTARDARAAFIQRSRPEHMIVFIGMMRRQCAGIGLLVFMRIGTHTIKAGKIHATYLQARTSVLS